VESNQNVNLINLLSSNQDFELEDDGSELMDKINTYYQKYYLML